MLLKLRNRLHGIAKGGFKILLMIDKSSKHRCVESIDVDQLLLLVIQYRLETWK